MFEDMFSGLGNLFDPMSSSMMTPPDMGLGGLNPQPPSMLDPDAMAMNAAKMGIPPPPMPGAQNTPGLGESLNGTGVPEPGIPLPRPRPAEAGPALTADEKAQQATQSKMNDPTNRFVSALKGVKMPTAPAPPKVSTPNPGAPRAPAAIKTGELMALLSALGMGGGGGAPRLGQTIGGR